MIGIGYHEISISLAFGALRKITHASRVGFEDSTRYENECGIDNSMVTFELARHICPWIPARGHLSSDSAYDDLLIFSKVIRV